MVILVLVFIGLGPWQCRSKGRDRGKSTFARLGQLRQFNIYELTLMTLKGERFAGFKIQR